jgi:hypothetical protein
MTSSILRDSSIDNQYTVYNRHNNTFSLHLYVCLPFNFVGHVGIALAGWHLTRRSLSSSRTHFDIILWLEKTIYAYALVDAYSDLVQVLHMSRRGSGSFSSVGHKIITNWRLAYLTQHQIVGLQVRIIVHNYLLCQLRSTIPYGLTFHTIHNLFLVYLVTAQ